MLQATCYMLYAACFVLFAICLTQHALYYMLHATIKLGLNQIHDSLDLLGISCPGLRHLPHDHIQLDANYSFAIAATLQLNVEENRHVLRRRLEILGVRSVSS